MHLYITHCSHIHAHTPSYVGMHVCMCVCVSMCAWSRDGCTGTTFELACLLEVVHEVVEIEATLDVGYLLESSTVHLTRDVIEGLEVKHVASRVSTTVDAINLL